MLCPTSSSSVDIISKTVIHKTAKKILKKEAQRHTELQNNVPHKLQCTLCRIRFMYTTGSVPIVWGSQLVHNPLHIGVRIICDAASHVLRSLHGINVLVNDKHIISSVMQITDIKLFTSFSYLCTCRFTSWAIAVHSSTDSTSVLPCRVVDSRVSPPMCCSWSAGRYN